MAALSLPNFGVGAGTSAGGHALGEGLRGTPNVQRAAFEDAMVRNGDKAGAAAGTPQAVAPQVVAPQVTPPAQATKPSAAATYENDAASRDRVRRSLELDGATRPSDGDAILGGLQRLRGAFDARHTRIGEIMKGNAIDTNALLAMQMEVAQYSILVDVSSKLTGKTTQSLDTLMKGQ